jgi:hypothetical protein
VELRPHAGVVVEGAERQAENRRMGVEFTHDRRAANAAKTAMGAGRGFEDS